MKRFCALLLFLLCLAPLAALAANSPNPAPWQFEVTISQGLATPAKDGRLFVILARRTTPTPPHARPHRPRCAASPGARPQRASPPAQSPCSTSPPLPSRSPISPRCPPATTSRRHCSIATPTCARRQPRATSTASRRRFTSTPHRAANWKLELTQQIPARAIARRHRANQVRQNPIQAPERVLWPPDLPSRGRRPAPRLRARTVAALSALGPHRRLEYAATPSVLGLMGEKSDFRKTWLADDTPRLILLQLDGAGPNGDPYYVNSANNGPSATRSSRNSSRTSRPHSAPSASRARASSPAPPPAAGSAWRSRSFIPTSSTAPGPPAPTRWTSARSNSSTSTRTTTPT